MKITPLQKTGAYVFVTGAVVMVIEMATFRILTPLFGSSTFIWGTVLGCLMIALALGYRFGGWYADRKPSMDRLFTIGIVASLYLVVIPLLIEPVSKIASFTDLINGQVSFEMIFAGLVLSILIFAPGVFILGFIAPTAVRVVAHQVKDVGQTAGKLYSISTIGSIFGTFIGAFLLIPLVGGEYAILIAAIGLMLFSALGFLPSLRPLILLLIPIATIVFYARIQDSDALYETQSLYNTIRVYDIDGTYLLRMNEGLGIHSVYNPKSVWTYNYWDRMSVIPSMLNAERVTILGTAGGTIPRAMHHLDPDIHITGVEIDPELTRIAEEYFGNSLEHVDMHHQDARLYIKEHQEDADVIIMDAYGKDAYIPFHLATTEFFEECKAHLRENGVLAFNLVAFSDQTQLYRAILSTVQTVYSNVYVMQVNGSGNFIILAADHELSWDDAPEFFDPKAIESANVIKQEMRLAPYAHGWVLTDNQSPVEYLTEMIIIDAANEIL